MLFMYYSFESTEMIGILISDQMTPVYNNWPYKGLSVDARAR